MADDKKSNDLTIDLDYAVHEIGELLITAAVSTQKESHRYLNDNKQYIVKNLELEIPVKLRIDELGQLRTTVVNKFKENDAIAKLKIQIEYNDQIQSTPLNIASQNISEFENFSKEQIDQLVNFRIFSGEDLYRITRNVSGYNSVQKIIPKKQLDDTLVAIDFVNKIDTPVEITTHFLRAGIRSFNDLRKKSTENIVSALKDIPHDEATDLVKNLKLNIDEIFNKEKNG